MDISPGLIEICHTLLWKCPIQLLAENPMQVSNFNRMSSRKQYAISFTRLQTQNYIKYKAFSYMHNSTTGKYDHLEESK